jgi:hypothetical protein
MTIPDLLREYILSANVITGYASAAFRDDAQTPFKNVTQKILLTVNSSGSADDLISSDSVTVYLMTKANPSGGDILNCANDTEKVKRLILRNKTGYNGNIFNFSVLSGVDGPYFDSQGRKAYGLIISVSSNSLC